jgi:putative ABC transport system permease protein
METLLQDVRYAWRSLCKSPGFTFIALLMLVLGIGANTAIFTVVNGVLLRPLPYQDSHRIVQVYDQNPERGTTYGPFSPQDFDDVKRSNSVYETLAAYNYTSGFTGMNLIGSGEPSRVAAAYVSDGFFQTFGVAAASGRTILPEENVAGRDKVVVLSDGLWRRRFGGDAGIVGQKITLEGAPFTVIGIMPRSFEFPAREVDVWAPLSLVTDDMVPHRRSLRWLNVVGRLKAGQTIDTATSGTTLLLKQLEQQYPDDNKGWGSAALRSLEDVLVGNVRPALLVLLAAVGLVLLIACANLANLLLARGTARSREIAVRVALGAQRSRLIRQLLTESIVLSLIAGAISLLIAISGTNSLIALGGSTIPRPDSIHVDVVVIVFAFIVSVITAVFFGLIPALKVTALNFYEALKQGGRGFSGGGNRLRDALVVAQIAVAAMLLVGSGLVLKSLWKLVNVDPGFDAQPVLALRISIPKSKHATEQQEVNYRNRLMQSIATVPGVVAVGGSKTMLLKGGGEPYEFTLQGPKGPVEVRTRSGAYMITPDYFRALGIPLLRGRAFSEADNSPVVIINQATAQQYWPEEDPVGKSIFLGKNRFEIVGVVRNVHNDGLTTEAATAIYVPINIFQRSNLNIFVRAAVPPMSLVNAVQRAIWSVEKDQPITDIAPLNQKVAATRSQPRFFTFLLGIFGALAVVLAAVGAYGVLAYTVHQRTNELGVRMALGAEPRDLLAMVLLQGFKLALAGLGIGLVGALLTTRLLSSLLFGVTATDPLTFITAGTVLSLVALLASYIPARRATKVDPMVALRYE